MLPNIPEYPIALLGSTEAGLVVTTFNPIYTSGTCISLSRDVNNSQVVNLKININDTNKQK